MSLTSKLLTVAKPAWMLVVMGATITAYSGQAEPYVSPAQLPQDPLFMFGGAAVAVVVGWLVLATVESRVGNRSWVAAGRRANLAPDGGGLFGRPDLVGTVDGHPVRVRTVSRKRGSAGEGGSTRQRFTLVEADLNRPAERGLVVAPGGGRITAGSATLDVDSEHVDGTGAGVATVEDGGLTVVGDDEAVARSVAGRAGDAVRAAEEVNVIYAGDAATVVSGYMPDTDELGSGLGGTIQRKMYERAEGALADRVPGDASTVTAETVGLVLDGDELRRQVTAVAAVAAAFEEATAHASAAG